jgi:hypothetical protein
MPSLIKSFVHALPPFTRYGKHWFVFSSEKTCPKGNRKSLMDKAFQFVAPDPQTAMARFTTSLRRAVKISPSKMNALVEHDNAQREAERTANGEKKRGPKLKA